MIRTVIIDDEPPILKLHKKIIEQSEKFEIVGCYSRVEDAMQMFEQLCPHVCFLDIRMPTKNGLDFTRELRGISPNTKFVFITAYAEYALKAFDVEAFDYLLKPLSIKDIERVAKRLTLRFASTQVALVKERLKVYLFGEPHFETEQQVAMTKMWRSGKTEELFFYLLLHGGRTFFSDALMEVLWPDHQYKSGKAMLHTTINRLKQSLKSIDISLEVTFRLSRYTFTFDSLWTDYDEIHGLIVEVNSVNHENYNRVKSGLELYKGRLLNSLDYHWLHSMRQRIENKMICLYELLVEFEMKQGNFNSAIVSALKGLQIETGHEPLNAQLLRCYLHVGNHKAFESHYTALVHLLKSEFGMEPSPKMKALYQKYIRLESG